MRNREANPWMHVFILEQIEVDSKAWRRQVLWAAQKSALEKFPTIL